MEGFWTTGQQEFSRKENNWKILPSLFRRKILYPYYKDVIHMKEFSEKIKKLRREKGITQKELADLVHVERSTIAGWETKDRVPDVQILIELAAVLETTVDELLKG